MCWMDLITFGFAPESDFVCLKSQVVLLQTSHSWANAGVLMDASMHRERGSFRNN